MKIKEIMTKEVNGISPEMNAKEALKLLQKMKISGLPVINDKNKLEGMFTEKEILAEILPGYIKTVGKFVYQDNPKAIQQKINSFCALSVKDVMRKNVVTVNDDTILYEAAHIMFTQNLRRVVVLNNNQEVTGIVSRGDVLKALFGEYTQL
ncbi:MAG: CBS domain-containing protein [Candidatus Omnitrophota bacterium]